MQWVALVYAVPLDLRSHFFHSHTKTERVGIKMKVTLGASPNSRLLVSTNSVAWAFLSLIWALISDGDLLQFGDEASVLLFSIIFAGVAFVGI